MKRIFALTLALITALGMFGLVAAAESNVTNGNTEKEPLKFNSDGSFKIMQIADIQDIIIFKGLNRLFITDLVDKEKPDLVVLTGDNISNGAGKIFNWFVEKSIDKFMRIFEEKGVPVAIVYGNHDEENCMNKEEQWEVYEKYNCFVGVRDSEELSGFGTYYLPINASDSDKQKFTLWFFDSQDYNKDESVGGYGCVEKDQIEWYIKTEKALTEANGGEIIPSFAFQHIIVPEIFDVLYKVGEADKETGEMTKKLDAPGPVYGEQTISENGFVYAFPEKYADEDTFLSETCCPPKYSNGQADALVDNGRVLGIAVGHDHKNSFVIPYKGLDIVQTPTASFGSYGDINRGARTITLNEKDLTSYETDVIFFRDYYDLEDEEMKLRFIFSNGDGERGTWERLKAYFKYIF